MVEMTSMQAYAAMQAFLTRYFDRTGSDDFGAFLGDLQLLSDGGSADPAALTEWNECVEAVLAEGRGKREAAE